MVSGRSALECHHVSFGAESAGGSWPGATPRGFGVMIRGRPEGAPRFSDAAIPREKSHPSRLQRQEPRAGLDRGRPNSIMRVCLRGLEGTRLPRNRDERLARPCPYFVRAEQESFPRAGRYGGEAGNLEMDQDTRNGICKISLARRIWSVLDWPIGHGGSESVYCQSKPAITASRVSRRNFGPS